jgi:hypothetical protein
MPIPPRRDKYQDHMSGDGMEKRQADVNDDAMELKTHFYVKTKEKVKGISRIEGTVDCPKNN